MFTSFRLKFTKKTVRMSVRSGRPSFCQSSCFENTMIGKEKQVICCQHGRKCKRGKNEERREASPSGKEKIHINDSLSSSVVSLSRRSMNRRKSSKGNTSEGTPTPDQFSHVDLGSFTFNENASLRSDKSSRKRGGSTDVYIGAMEPADAEKHISRPLTFVLYHCVYQNVDSSRSLLRKDSPYGVAPLLKLSIAYRTSTGDCIHFPIVESQERQAHDGQNIVYYSVGSDRSHPKFLSIEGLIKNYSTWTYSNPYTNTPGEVFPVKNFSIIKELIPNLI